jgi:hypothetical protein
MMDGNIAAVSCSAVYRVLGKAGLNKKWAVFTEEARKGYEQPRSIHERRHTDLSYIKIRGRFYYFTAVL